MTLSGKGRRLKGHNFERRIAKELREYFSDAKRGYQSRNNVDLNPDVEVPYFFIECKAHKSCNIKAALKQALEKRKPEDTRIPLSICKDDRKPIIVSIYYEDFINLIAQFYSEDKN